MDISRLFLQLSGQYQFIFSTGDGSLTGANLFRQEWQDLVKELLSNGRITEEEATECSNIQVNF